MVENEQVEGAVERQPPKPGIPMHAPAPPRKVPPGEEEWRKTFWWPVGLGIGLLAIACIAWWNDACDETTHFDLLLPTATLIWIAILFAWFVSCFTGDPYHRRTRGITFAYFFMALSFGMVAVMIADIGKARKFGVIEGCVENLDSNSVIPIQCDYPIRALLAGKVTTERTHNAAAPANPRGAAPKGEVQSPPAQDAQGQNRQGANAPPVQSGQDQNPPVPGPEDEVKPPGGRSFEELVAVYYKNKNYHYLLNIGGHLHILQYSERISVPARSAEAKATPDTICTPPVYAVRGGIPVPVYFIVLALIGGAISLAKSIPGIQKRSDDSWPGTAAEPRLDPGDVRELILFQILQFVSAPLLAVVAYYTIKPESFATTVALGFLVGFSSEQILAAIRNMFKGIQRPDSAMATAAPSGSIHGKVTRAGRDLANAGVAVGGTTISARTDTDGEFRLTAVPLKTSGTYVLTITEGADTKSVNVTLNTPKPVDAGTITLP